jgi:hypothetical protein
MPDRARNWLQSASAFTVAAARVTWAAVLVLVVGAVALVGVNLALAFGVWGETLGAPLVAALVAFALIECWAWLRVKLGVDEWPAWRVLAGTAGLTYLVFLVFPIAYAFLGTPFLICVVVVAVAALLVRLAVRIYQSHIGQTVVNRLQTVSTPRRVALGAGIVVAFAVATVSVIGLLTRFTAFNATVPATARPPLRAVELPQTRRLALAFRPLLFFDSKETFAPLDIDRLVRDERVMACHSTSDCDRIGGVRDINNSYSFLKLNEEVLPPGDPSAAKHSAIYYHFSTDANRAFLDYWWYFSSNPSPELQAFLCGPGTLWIGIACGNHPSDWEGLTVILSRCRANSTSCAHFDEQRSYRPLAVRYGQHEGDATFSWSHLQSLWNELRVPSAPWHRERVTRTLAFVARKSHATYEKPCGGASLGLSRRLLAYCPQTLRPALTERRDGRQPWIDNDCGECLKPLPVTRVGEPADRNAFRGHWGTRDCILRGAFCSTGEAPEGPSQHDRYEHPGGT